MKKALILILILINTGLLIGQNIIIGDPHLSGNSIPFTDTTILFVVGDCNGVNYEIDLDGDENYDVNFKLYDCWGGEYQLRRVTVWTLNNNISVHIDTNYQGLVLDRDTINNEWIQVPETFTVIKKYVIGDTILFNEISSTNEYMSLYRADWAEIGGEWLRTEYISHFYGDTNYIAFTKNIEDSTSLYYIKVFLNTYGLHFISAKSNSSPNSIHETSSKPVYFYPNPVVNVLSLKESYEEFEIYTLQGLLVYYGKLNENQNTLDLSHLKSGFYLLKLKYNSKELTTKFIKQ